MTGELSDTRKAFSQALCELAEEDDRIIGMSADMGYIIAEFMKKFPERFVNVGIAEQNMVGVACGLALSGMIPFVTTMSCFLSLRACEQIRTDVCYGNANVKIVGTGGGTVYGNQGNTHMALEDVAIVSSFANMTVVAPADGVETYEAIKAVARHSGPVYVRIGRGISPLVYEEGYLFRHRKLEFRIGQAVTLREGSDVCLISSGCWAVSNALDAADILERKGVSAMVVNVHTLKPLDHEAILRAARLTGRVVTVEDHQIRGGLGAAVCQAVASEAPTRVRCLGIPDVFVPIADHQEILRRYSLDAAGIAKAVLTVIDRLR